MNEQHLTVGDEIDWEAAYAGDVPRTPVARDIARGAIERERP